MLNFPVLRRQNSGQVVDSPALHNKISQWGATLVGFGDVSEGLAEEISHLPRAIAIAVRHPAQRGILKSGIVTAYSNQFEDVDAQLADIQKKIVTYLKSRGCRTLAIPPDSARADGTFVSRLYSLFPHKTAATCAGLGWIGKSGLLVNRDNGPRLSWATVLTDAQLEVCPEPVRESRCGTCNKCVKSCPSGAIRDQAWHRGESTGPIIDIKACADHMNYTVKYFNKYICGLCILACPLGGSRH